ncbi:MAG: alpha/beta fold hydrolase [Rhizobiaceae bacterium]
MFIHTDDASIMVSAFGPGPRTFVAHGGWVGSGELWFPVFEHLSRSWRTVTYDHRGTGATIDRSPKISFEALVSDLFTVLDRLDIERCVLAGESAGASIVVEAALRHPQRFEGLVLVDGRTRGNRSPQLDRMLQGCRVDFPRTMDAFIDACIPEDDCVAERAWGKLITNRSTAKAAVELMECLDGFDVDHRLPGLDIPTLILHGSRDAITPLAAAERLAAMLPRAHLEVADGAGHVPTVTRPEWVAARIGTFFLL